MITDYIGGEGSAETPKNDYVIYGWPLMVTSFFYVYVIATSFFYIYVEIYIDIYIDIYNDIYIEIYIDIYYDIYIDIYISFTNWWSVQSFYWTPFLNFLVTISYLPRLRH